MNNTNNTIPSVSKTAFSCPHCNALTSQIWFDLHARKNELESRVPNIPDLSKLEAFEKKQDVSPETKKMIREWAVKMNTGKPFLQKNERDPWLNGQLMNIFVSECFNCSEFSVWVHDQLIYPNIKIEILPNQDTPAHIKFLFEEAREIVAASPKGAAAILRLSIQHLCKELGESGQNIDNDIASLVSKGLNPLVQQALDVVRVIGNEAVHPGEINLDDNRETAYQLFSIFNLIVNQMISHPKQVKEIYGSLPENKLKGIEQRNIKAIEKSKNT